jgi:hypothetical protein
MFIERGDVDVSPQMNLRPRHSALQVGVKIDEVFDTLISSAGQPIDPDIRFARFAEHPESGSAKTRRTTETTTERMRPGKARVVPPGRYAGPPPFPSVSRERHSWARHAAPPWNGFVAAIRDGRAIVARGLGERHRLKS